MQIDRLIIAVAMLSLGLYLTKTDIISYINVTELTCKTLYDASFKCKREDIELGKQAELRINNSNDSVTLIYLTKNGLYEDNYDVMKNCAIYNDKNWKCDDSIAPLNAERGMLNGNYYYYRYNGDHSSDQKIGITGLENFLFRNGLLSLDNVIKSHTSR